MDPLKAAVVGLTIFTALMGNVIGYAAAKARIADLCDTKGEFNHHWSKYECQRKIIP